MPELYRNAWYAQLKKKVDELQEEIEKAIELPSVTSADDGKVLTVDNGQWTAEDVPNGLPVVQTTDEGKVLTVDNSGQWVAGIPYPVNYSTSEKVVGTWIDGTPVYLRMSPNKGTTLPIDQSWVDTGIEVTGEIINVYGSILRDDEPIGICWFNSDTAVKWLIRNNKLLLGVLAPVGGSYKINNIFATYTKSTT